jgi:hypothetical protein
LARASGPVHVTGGLPELPAPAEIPLRESFTPLPVLAARFDQRVDPATVRWPRGELGGEMELRAWQRFADGREADVHSLALFADALPPPIFNRVVPGWVPTVELTVHVRARPAPGWLRSMFRTRFLVGGYLEEDGELFDERGVLVAMSRQLASAPAATWREQGEMGMG